LSFYLDTNAIYSYIFEDSHSALIDRWIDRNRSGLVISDWVDTEFHALVHRRLRSGGLTGEAAHIGVADFDAFARERALRLPLTAASGAHAAMLARDPTLKLSAADALHLAVSAEGAHCLVTFDIRLAEAARAQGFAIEVP
jgi:predicted nucleic acid-binding protein